MILKKNAFLFVVIIMATGVAAAQTKAINGTVTDAFGHPLRLAVIQDNLNHTTYTDSLGFFSIGAGRDAILRVNCEGYRDTAFYVKNRNSLEVVLQISGKNIKPGAVTQEVNDQSANKSFNDDVTLGASFNGSLGAILPSFTPKEETVGSRYLIKGWAQGYIVTIKDSTIQTPLFLYAYDKMGGTLLLTTDKRKAIELDKKMIKSFTLYDNDGKAYTYAKVPRVDNDHFVQVLVTGNKYTLYKSTKTKFEKANYTSDGVMSSGHNYDEYADDNTYYVYDEQANKLQKVALKKKDLKAIFAKDADQWNKFMVNHSSDSIDDSYLIILGSNMNE